jgi:osmotically inducible lipoprotein OsmB
MSLASKIAIAALALGLAGCGYQTTDRAASGAAIGAGAGLLVDEPVAGALVGGAAGALTSPDQINLGTPIWRR